MDDGVIFEGYLAGQGRLKNTPARKGQQKSLEMLNFKALCVLQDTAENRVWWRRGQPYFKLNLLI